jgi:hypothetical protein
MKVLTEKIEQAKRDHPDAICFVGSVCPNMETIFLPRGPCGKYLKRWPTSHCRVRFDLDGTLNVEAKKWMQAHAAKTDDNKLTEGKV